ncbi:carbon-nitrogen hydrolase family protein [Tenacibaculum agarivorans]|uniref:carbon-nitrogen hydrolase family protein n=1 Tax=Tenacibaculum agarivorans TaxID=1908389 RepID=UPI00094BC005|nr:carbon-nitrogen hydrolase family protein [Tenacibaculum agarivorans]
MSSILKIGMAQISPVWLNKEKTIDKVKSFVIDAAKEKCDLVIFGEGLLPGYPFWLSITNGSEFNSKIQKEIHAHYIKNAIEIEKGELKEICDIAKQYNIAIYLGIIERATDRGNHSLYCSLVYIDKNGEIKSVHRKLQPTYEERLTWSPGDGNGLKVHSLEDFTVGGLNCWENWMPLPRTALYAQGENLHIAVWPGAERNTFDITKFIAKESRSFVVSVSGFMTIDDFPKDTPNYDTIIKDAPQVLANGGSCIAGPDGEWVIPPMVGEEGLFTGEIDYQKVLEERHNFDCVGHYSRPDVTKLTLNTERQSIIHFSN